MLKAKLLRKGTLLLLAVCLSVLGVVTAPGSAEASLCCTSCYPEYDACMSQCWNWQSACEWDCYFSLQYCESYCDPGC